MTTEQIKAKQAKLQALEMEQIELIQKLQQQLSAANEQRLLYSGAIRLTHEMIQDDETVIEPKQEELEAADAVTQEPSE